MEVRDTTLVIGYGNTLRGDDGVGFRVAEAVAGWSLRGVEAIAVHQLGPELAASLASARRAFFVDARMAEDSEPYQLSRIAAADSASALLHTCDPRSLLALTRAAFGRQPEAWSITIPAIDVGLGEGLSPAADRSMSAALGRLGRILTGAEDAPATPE